MFVHTVCEILRHDMLFGSRIDPEVRRAEEGTTCRQDPLRRAARRELAVVVSDAFARDGSTDGDAVRRIRVWNIVDNRGVHERCAVAARCERGSRSRRLDNTDIGSSRAASARACICASGWPALDASWIASRWAVAAAASAAVASAGRTSVAPAERRHRLLLHRLLFVGGEDTPVRGGRLLRRIMHGLAICVRVRVPWFDHYVRSASSPAASSVLGASTSHSLVRRAPDWARGCICPGRLGSPFTTRSKSLWPSMIMFNVSSVDRRIEMW